ncbi:MAG: ABC transporter permease subunit [Chloroflexota bacterium]
MDQGHAVFRQGETWRHTPRWLLRLRPILGRDFAAAYAFMLPTVLLMGGLVAYPFLRAAYTSLTRTHGREIGPFVGLANYRALWEDRFFRESVAITLRYTGWSVVIALAIAMLAALLLHRLGSRADVLAGLLLLPWIMPEIVRAITWKGLLDPLYGGVNRVLIGLGLIQRGFPFFGGLDTALPSVILVNVWQRVPFFAINLLAGLKAADPELYEAAGIDGASPWRQFLHVTLPALQSVILVIGLLGAIWSLNEFNLVYLLTGGGPANVTKLYSVLACNYARTRMGMGVAVALSMAPAFVALIAVLGRTMVRGGGAQPPDASHRTPASELARWLGWPLGAALRGLLRAAAALFWLANDAAEGLAAALARIVPQRRRPRRVGAVVAGALLAVLLLFELAPFYWVFVTAFKTELQITRFESVLWPRPWSLDQFRRLLAPNRSFGLWLQNTLLLALVTPALSTFIAAAGAYALTRLRWRGAAPLANAVLVSYLMPTILILLPIYHLFIRLGLTNTRLSLIISYPTLMVPFALWLLMGYIGALPMEIEDAARIDGCGRWQTFLRVVLPLSRPALAAAALFSVTLAWSEFLFAMTFIASEAKMTLPMGLAQMIFGDVAPWGQLSAAVLIIAVPVLALYAVGQRFMLAGLTAGAVKG